MCACVGMHVHAGEQSRKDLEGSWFMVFTLFQEASTSANSPLSSEFVLYLFLYYYYFKANVHLLYQVLEALFFKYEGNWVELCHKTTYSRSWARDSACFLHVKIHLWPKMEIHILLFLSIKQVRVCQKHNVLMTQFPKWMSSQHLASWKIMCSVIL